MRVSKETEKWSRVIIFPYNHTHSRFRERRLFTPLYIFVVPSSGLIAQQTRPSLFPKLQLHKAEEFREEAQCRGTVEGVRGRRSWKDHMSVYRTYAPKNNTIICRAPAVRRPSAPSDRINLGFLDGIITLDAEKPFSGILTGDEFALF